MQILQCSFLVLLFYGHKDFNHNENNFICFKAVWLTGKYFADSALRELFFNTGIKVKKNCSLKTSDKILFSKKWILGIYGKVRYSWTRTLPLHFSPCLPLTLLLGLLMFQTVMIKAGHWVKYYNFVLFTKKLCRNCAFPLNFDTRKLGKIKVLSAVGKAQCNMQRQQPNAGRDLSIYFWNSS